MSTLESADPTLNKASSKQRGFFIHFTQTFKKFLTSFSHKSICNFSVEDADFYMQNDIVQAGYLFYLNIRGTKSREA